VLVPSTTAVLSCEAGVTTCPRQYMDGQQGTFDQESWDSARLSSRVVHMVVLDGGGGLGEHTALETVYTKAAG
jgi:hypothetical protein